MIRRVLLALAALTLTAGTVPDGLGAWMSDGRKIIPSTSAIVRYRYDPAFDAVWRDRIMWAVASVDFELLSVRQLYSISDSPSPYQVHFDLDDSVAPPGCSDEINGNCILASTTCGTGGALVGIAYRLCTQFRVRVYVNRIVAVSVHRGSDLAAYAHAILRHEVGHTLGLPEALDLGGAPINACQRALIEGYVVDEAPWTFTPKPAACP